MGADRCAWVRLDAGDMGGHKTRQTETKPFVHDMFVALWPGKFPRTSCFAKNKNKCMDDPG